MKSLLLIAATVTTYPSGLGMCQSGETRPKFEAADVHVSAKSANAFPRTGPARGGRYEIKNDTMVDLVRTAYGYDAAQLAGTGPLRRDR